MGARATDLELMVLAAHAVKSRRVLLVNGAAYLDGDKVRSSRVAKALETCMRAAMRR